MRLEKTTPSPEVTAEKLKDTKTLPPKPKGWVRWSGLGMFLGIVGGVFALSYLGLSYGLKKQIEHYASEAWGAQVDIGSLGFGLSPLSVAVKGIELTDPDAPMENLITIEQLHASLSVYHWVVGRTVIEDLSFAGFAMHQPRTHSGALAVKPAAEETQAATPTVQTPAFSLPKMNLPDPNTILQRETLETLQSAQKIQAELTKIDQAWSKLQAKLPNQQAINDYQKRFEALTKGDFANPTVLLQKQKDFEALKREVIAQKAAIDDGQALLKSVQGLQGQVGDLKSLPEKDYQRLMAKYDLSNQGVANVTYLLFGPKIQSWLVTGQEWMARLQPVFAKVKELREKHAAEAAAEEAAKPKRAFGVEVAYKEYDPQPAFMIKRIQGDAKLAWGDVLMRVNKVNFNHAESKIPVTFTVQAMPVGQKSPLNIVGESNYTNPQAPVNRADIQWTDYQLRDTVLSGDKALPVLLKQGDLNLYGQLALVGTERIKGHFDAGFSGVKLDASQSDSADVKKYIAPILADIQKFNVNTAISGEMMSPKLDARSDLDKLLSKAFSRALDRELDNAKVEVKRQLNNLLAEQLAPINQQLTDLLGNQAALNAQGIDLDAILNGKMPDTKEIEKQAQKAAEDAAKKEAEKIIQNQTKGLLKGFGF